MKVNGTLPLHKCGFCVESFILEITPVRFLTLRMACNILKQTDVNTEQRFKLGF